MRACYHWRLLRFTASFRSEAFVEGLFAALLGCLNILVFHCEALGLLFSGQGLCDKGSLTILFHNTCTEELCWALNYCSNLTKFWRLCLSIFFFIVSFWIEY